MYLPSAFAERDVPRLQAFVEAHPFGLVLDALAPGRVELSHLPFELDRSAGPLGTLRTHVSRANPIWRGLSPERPLTCVFQGPHGYVSPRWYGSRQEVPTWNYAVVHAAGPPRVVDDRSQLLALLERLASRFEGDAPGAWSPSELERTFLDELLADVVLFEIRIDSMAGKMKLSQNRELADRHGVVRALRERGSERDVELADAVAERLPPGGTAP